MSTTPPFSSHIAEGFGTSGATSGLNNLLQDWIASGDFSQVLSSQYGIAPPIYVPQGMRLPASGFDGQECSATVDKANGVTWKFRYRTSALLPYAWEATGAQAPMRAIVLANESTSSASFGNLATVGPRVIAPFGGDYDVLFGAQPNGATVANSAQVQVWNATTGFNPALNMFSSAAGSMNDSGTISVRVTSVSAGDQIILLYSVNTGTVSFANRWLAVTPVRVAGG